VLYRELQASPKFRDLPLKHICSAAFTGQSAAPRVLPAAFQAAEASPDRSVRQSASFPYHRLQKLLALGQYEEAIKHLTLALSAPDPHAMKSESGEQLSALPAVDYRVLSSIKQGATYVGSHSMEYFSVHLLLHLRHRKLLSPTQCRHLAPHVILPLQSALLSSGAASTGGLFACYTQFLPPKDQVCEWSCSFPPNLLLLLFYLSRVSA